MPLRARFEGTRPVGRRCEGTAEGAAGGQARCARTPGWNPGADLQGQQLRPALSHSSNRGLGLSLAQQVSASWLTTELAKAQHPRAAVQPFSIGHTRDPPRVTSISSVPFFESLPPGFYPGLQMLLLDPLPPTTGTREPLCLAPLGLGAEEDPGLGHPRPTCPPPTLRPGPEAEPCVQCRRPGPVHFP